jgi:TolB-like protein/tetratricopeptide (TPR) repeat protein
MSLREFLAELRHRGVLKVATAYLAGGLVVLEAGTHLLHNFEAPHWVLKVFTSFLILGFPVICLLAWGLEFGSTGVHAATPTRPEPAPEARRTDALFAALLAAIFLLMTVLVVGQWRRPIAEVAQPEAVVTAPAEVADGKHVVAVLPFVNMSADPEQDYFADGISEELLNLLAKVPELRVIARTSSFAFKGKDVGIAEIARQLHATHVLEGSVRRSGDKLRITTQLIRTSDSSHLWSQSYDRELTDMFAVQEEIASAVVQQLQTTLLNGQSSVQGGVHPDSARTAIDPEAYERYLRGRYEMWSWSKENVERAEALIERAVQHDPSFGDAWASLAETAVLRHEIHQVRDREAAYARATDAARHALASAPKSAEGHAALSHILWHERRWRLAEEEASRAVALNPSSAMGYEWLGMALTALGRLEEANAAFRQALALDPLSQTYYANAAAVLVNLGRFGDAETMIQRAAQLGQAGFTPFLWWTGLDVLLRVGRVDEAERWVERCAALGPRVELLVQILRARVLFAQGHKREARDLLAAVGSKIPPGAGLEVFMSGASFMIGEVDSGFYWLTRTTASADLLATARFLPEIQQVIADPRMQALLKETSLEGLPATGPGTPPAK